MLLFFIQSNDTKTIVCSAVTGIIIRDKKTNGIESLKVSNGTFHHHIILINNEDELQKKFSRRFYCGKKLRGKDVFYDLSFLKLSNDANTDKKYP